MFKRILVGYDGSQPAEKAFRAALNLAASYQAALTVLAVVRQQDFVSEFGTLMSSLSPWVAPEGSESDLASRSIQDQRERFQQRFMLLRDTAAQRQIVPIFQVLVGQPAEQIVLQAEAQAIDLILVGHRGNGVFERWLLGSISKAVIAHAKCTVLVIR